MKGIMLEIIEIGYALVIDEDEKTLLLRKCISENGNFTPTPTPRAMFVSKDLVKNAYWIKQIKEYELSEPLHVIYTSQLISKFFNV